MNSFLAFLDYLFYCPKQKRLPHPSDKLQIHVLESGKVHIYSRNSEDNTSKYPDIIERMPKVIKDTVKSAVIDSESVAWDREKKQIQPFQVLSTRKRKVKEM